MKKTLLTLLLAASMILSSVSGTWAAETNPMSSMTLQDWLKGALTKYFEQVLGQNPGVPERPESPENGENELQQGIGSQAKQVVNLVNRQRSDRGLASLKHDSVLTQLAQKKAEDMAKNHYFSHTSPTLGSAFDMLQAAEYTYRTAGENIAQGQKTAAAVMNGWMNSSGHRANILHTGYTQIGTGYAVDSRGTPYWVQIFAG